MPFRALLRALRDIKWPLKIKLPKYIRDSPKGVTLAIRVQPRSSRNEFIADPNDDQLKVRITAPPVDSAANNALPKFIAKSLEIPPRNVSLISGERSRIKTLLITSIDAQVVSEKLRAQK
ncbi:MAG: DUF167 domain-containing protein [Verrucomicrobia bacterium]|nr:DUF167 domain-containing protein [Verrucomicrobiota bacterium]